MINSLRFGIMWHGGGTSGDAGSVDISGATVFTTAEAVFLDKGQAVKISVDGTSGAKLTPGNGVIMQLMDDDDPGSDPTTNGEHGGLQRARPRLPSWTRRMISSAPSKARTLWSCSRTSS